MVEREAGGSVNRRDAYFVCVFLLFMVGLFFAAFTYLFPPRNFISYAVQIFPFGMYTMVFLVHYDALYGGDEFQWLLINIALGFYAAYVNMGSLAALFGADIRDYPLVANMFPFLWFLLFVPVVRQLLIDAAGARDRPNRRGVVDALYVVAVVGVNTFLWVD